MLTLSELRRLVPHDLLPPGLSLYGPEPPTLSFDQDLATPNYGRGMDLRIAQRHEIYLPLPLTVSLIIGHLERLHPSGHPVAETLLALDASPIPTPTTKCAP